MVCLWDIGISEKWVKNESWVSHMCNRRKGDKPFVEEYNAECNCVVVWAFFGIDKYIHCYLSIITFKLFVWVCTDTSKSNPIQQSSPSPFPHFLPLSYHENSMPPKHQYICLFAQLCNTHRIVSNYSTTKSFFSSLENIPLKVGCSQSKVQSFYWN